MRTWTLPFSSLMVVSAVAAGNLQPSVIETQFPTEDVVVASLALRPSQEKDASPRIQSAIDKLAETGGGVLFLHSGTYPLAQRITIREGVTVRGDWLEPAAGGLGKGTILSITAGKNQAEEQAVITMERGTGLREITLWYPEQRFDRAVPYPWTVRTSAEKGGNNLTVYKATFINPYRGICIGPEGNELHTLREVYMTALDQGLSVDGTTDIGRLTHLRIGPSYWEKSPFPGTPVDEKERSLLRALLRDNATALNMGRSDWEYMYDLKVDGYATGLLMRKGERGQANAVLFGGEFTRCGTALKMEALNQVGLSVTGTLFHGTEYAVHATRNLRSVVQFNTCQLSGDKTRTVYLQGPATLTFQNCTFDSENGQVFQGVDGRVSFMGCDFPASKTKMNLGPDMEYVRILGNQFVGEPLIENQVKRGDVLISHCDLDFEKVEISPHRERPLPRPSTDKLFIVTDFGASPESQDNTEAFQKALRSAGDSEGGTVYVPPGNYPFKGHLIVPSGVELRGCFDVPHHTVSGGSVLMPLEGQGQHEGPPFLQLEEGSGLRGITAWYPEQNLTQIASYPWTVRSLGKDCWLIDVTLGNPYQGVDFGSHPSEGHFIRYLCGAPLKRGLYVSQSHGEGWVEDIQFNPHYSVRLHSSLPHPPYKGDVGGQVIEYQRAHLHGLAFGRCQKEHIRGTFIYAAYDGLAFVDDQGGTNARIIEHGTDTGSRGIYLEKAGEEGLTFINTQLVPLSAHEVAALVVASSFQEKASLFNSQMWAGTVSAWVEGKGQVLLQQLNTLTGPIHLKGGSCRVEGVCFQKEMVPHVKVEDACEKAVILACFSHKNVLIEADPKSPLYARANGFRRNAFETTPHGMQAKPPEGVYDSPLRLKLKAKRYPGIRYTIDGTQPSNRSPLYKRPILLRKKGLWEIRFAGEDKEGSLHETARALYEIK